MMELVSEAIIFSVKCHDGMRRKNSETPYILHPMEAAAIVASMTSDQEVIAAAVLHDVVEDADVALDELTQRFGKRVSELVASETENKREYLPAESTWKLRKEEALRQLQNTKDRDVKILYLGDKLANMRSIYYDWQKQGHAIWRYFNQKDPVQQAWYYRTIADSIRELSDTLAWREYNELIQIVFADVTE